MDTSIPPGNNAEARQKAFKGYPRGWFVVSFSDELKVGDVHTLNYFGKKYALYRGDDGVPRIMDAYCPHLGGSLARGKVNGDSLVCPFHAWRFGPDGKCNHIPYSARIPGKAVVDTTPCKEVNNIIFMWHDPAGGAPQFDVPVLPECDDADWMPWVHAKLRVHTHPHELVENVVDVGHFSPVHRTQVEKFENEFTGHIAKQINSGVAYPIGGGVDRYHIEATYYGPGFQISRWDGFMEARLINANTMVDMGSMDLRFAVMLKKGKDARQTEHFQRGYVENMSKGFQEDIDIWMEKRYVENPVLCEGDGPFHKLRKWYQQFYV
jgi:3-ketosteroid 9alpha-monooxygenase subunit A